MTRVEVDELVAWRDQLVRWRKTLCDRMLAVGPRDSAIQGLRLSVMRIDRNLDFRYPVEYWLTTPLGELMAGCSWRGCLPDVERRIREFR